MSVDTWLLVVTSLTALVWPAVAIANYVSFRRCRTLVPLSDFDSRSDQPRISVVMPARNEAASIATALRSVLAQPGVELEVIVINDGSSDETGAIADQLAAGDSRVRVLHNPVLRHGWLGKANAMRHGARIAGGDFILFTDADIRHEPGSFAAAAREMKTCRLSLLSLLPRFVWQSIWENATVPAFMLALAGFWSGRIHDADSDDAFAIGAFIMVDAKVYRALGGHEAVRAEMFDDVMLARHFKRSGERVAFRAAPDCLNVRMYRSARAVFDGTVKSCLAAFGESFWVAVPLTLVFSVGSLSVLAAPWVGLINHQPVLLEVGLLVYLEVWLAALSARPYLQVSLRRIAAFVVGVPLLLSAALFATYQAVFFGAVLWRGRAIRVGE